MPIISAEHLAMDYADHGDRSGRPVLVLHGWPDDASTLVRRHARQPGSAKD